MNPRWHGYGFSGTDEPGLGGIADLASELASRLEAELQARDKHQQEAASSLFTAQSRAGLGYTDVAEGWPAAAGVDCELRVAESPISPPLPSSGLLAGRGKFSFDVVRPAAKPCSETPSTILTPGMATVFSSAANTLSPGTASSDGSGALQLGTASRLGELEKILCEKTAQLQNLIEQDEEGRRTVMEQDFEIEQHLREASREEVLAEELSSEVKMAEVRAERRRQRRKEEREASYRTRRAQRGEELEGVENEICTSTAELRERRFQVWKLEASEKARAEAHEVAREEIRRKLHRLSLQTCGDESSKSNKHCSELRSLADRLRQRLFEEERRVEELKTLTGQEAVSVRSLRVAWEAEEASANSALAGLAAELSAGAAELRVQSDATRDVEMTLARVTERTAHDEDVQRRGFNQEINFLEDSLHNCEQMGGELRCEVSVRHAETEELHSRLERRERTLRNLEREKCQWEANEQAMHETEARLAAVLEKRSVIVPSPGVPSAPESRESAAGENSVAVALNSALRELGFEDAAQLPSLCGPTDLLLCASTFDVAARKVQAELQDLLAEYGGDAAKCDKGACPALDSVRALRGVALRLAARSQPLAIAATMPPFLALPQQP